MLDDPFDKSSDTYFQRNIISKVLSEDVRNHLLATSNSGKGTQDDINV